MAMDNGNRWWKSTVHNGYEAHGCVVTQAFSLEFGCCLGVSGRFCSEVDGEVDRYTEARQ